MLSKDLPLEPCDYKGWLQAGGHLIIFCLTGFITTYFFLIEEWFWLLFHIFHGIVGSFFKGHMPIYELGHGSVSNENFLNAIFLRIYSIISWHNFLEYAISHTYHHRYTLYKEGDQLFCPRSLNKETAFTSSKSLQLILLEGP